MGRRIVALLVLATVVVSLTAEGCRPVSKWVPKADEEIQQAGDKAKAHGKDVGKEVLQQDVDHDGWPNQTDNCPTTFNPGQGNFCDLFD